MQLQTLHKISLRKNNFGELDRLTRCSYHKVVRNKTVLQYIFLCLVSELLARSLVRFFAMVRKRQVRRANSMTKLRKPTCRSFYRGKKINKLFAGLGSVRIAKNCDLGLENAALGLRPRAVFSRPRSKFFTIRTSQPANNI